MTEIAVFGAGAIGCWVGGMHATRHAVTLVGRPRLVAELAAHPLVVSELDAPSRTPRAAHATAEVAAARSADLVLVCVKSMQTAEAGAELARVVRPDAIVVSLQNGIGNADVLLAALPGRRVLAGMVPFNVVRRGPGAYHRATAGELIVEDGAGAPLVLGAARLAGLPMHARADMRAVQWAKLVMNLNNAINALSGLPLAAELAERAYRCVLAAAQREALGLLARAGQPLARLTPVPARLVPRILELPDALFRVAARRMLAIDPHARSSMQDDLVAGRPTEIAYLQGEVVALAERLGARAPVNARLAELVRTAEAGGRRDFGGGELLARITT